MDMPLQQDWNGTRIGYRCLHSFRVNIIPVTYSNAFSALYSAFFHLDRQMSNTWDFASKDLLDYN
jgi:hypothetical protein